MKNNFDEDMSEVIGFVESKCETKVVKIPANTMVASEGMRCVNFSLVIEGAIKVYKTSEDGKIITLYHINKNEGCILTTASIFNDLPFPAMAQTISECKVITFPAHYLTQYFNENLAWRKFIFSMLLDKMATLVNVVDDLAFYKLDKRLMHWLYSNKKAGVVEATHQEIANQLASTREVISRSLKKLEKQKLIQLSRGKIVVM
jgi:CRP/FNR family transcriptional regulator